MKCLYCNTIVEEPGNCPNCGAPLEDEYDEYDYDEEEYDDEYDDEYEDEPKIKPLKFRSDEYYEEDDNEGGKLKFTWFYSFAFLLTVLAVGIFCSGVFAQSSKGTFFIWQKIK